MPSTSIGAMNEELLIQSSAPADQPDADRLVSGVEFGTGPFGSVPVMIGGLTQTGGLATAVLQEAHSLVTGDYVDVAGATPTGYNLRTQVTVIDDTTITFAVDASLDEIAEGDAITVTYYSDALGGRKEVWTDVDTIWAELIPLTGSELIAAGALQAQQNRRFRAYARNDIVPKMRAIWTPSAFYGTAARTLEIAAVLPIDDGRDWMAIDTGEIAR